jgi:hypothetical protein
VVYHATGGGNDRSLLAERVPKGLTLTTFA